jgi:sugar fermentation stimulation protein A
MIDFIEPKTGFFVNRYKRFFATINIDGQDQTCYCPNTGKMSDILNPGSECIVSNILAKNSLCWQAIREGENWVGVNTFLPNKLVQNILPILFPNQEFKRELRFQGYRADFASQSIVVEVKHVHWKNNDRALFPDCITERGTRQMNVLSALQKSGYSCYLIYILQRNDIEIVSSSSIDLKYRDAAQSAKEAGVQFLAFNCNISFKGVSINKQINVL